MKLKDDFFKNLIKEVEDFAKLDIFREERAGKPEAVFGEGKSLEELVKIIEAYVKEKRRVLVTRVKKEHLEELKKRFKNSRVNEKARTVIVGELPQPFAKVAVLSAGTSDIAVAEEACETLIFLGIEPLKFYDVGVAGIHRLLEPLKKCIDEKVVAIIVVAGMEGALPSVVAGLVDVPVIGVPTSIGYGTSLKGFTALFSMLSSCSSGLAVVNIDNGFGAAVFASLIAKVAKRGELK